MAKRTVTPGTPLTQSQTMLLAAIRGGIDIGLYLPRLETVKRAARIIELDEFDLMVREMWGPWIGNDSERYKRVYNECWAWLDDQLDDHDDDGDFDADGLGMTVEYVHRVWPEVAALVFAKGIIPENKGEPYPTYHQAMILAAIVGGIKMKGQLGHLLDVVPSRKRIQKAALQPTLESMVCDLWGDCFVTDDLAREFIDKCWDEKVKLSHDDMSIARIRKMWPKIASLVF
jgi:hypothetical protein